MTTVTIKNLSTGPRVFTNLAGQRITILPEEKRTFDMHPYHVQMAERDAKSAEPSIELVVAAEDQEAYDDAITDIRTANKEASRNAAMRGPVTPLPSDERRPRTDTRFVTDPRNKELDGGSGGDGGSGDGDPPPHAKTKTRRGARRARERVKIK